jgi:hypothetical protein
VRFAIHGGAAGGQHLRLMAYDAAGASYGSFELTAPSASWSVVEVPLVGWVAKQRPAGHSYDCGFKVSVYGAQQSTDPWDPDCGNGVRTDGGEITGNDPADTSVAVDPAFVAGWVAHLVARFGDAAHGGGPTSTSTTSRCCGPTPTAMSTPSRPPTTRCATAPGRTPRRVVPRGR